MLKAQPKQLRRLHCSPRAARSARVRSSLPVASATMPHRFCIVSDLDHTMVDHTDPQYASLLEFNRIWSAKFRHDSYLVFSTGRSLTSYLELRKEAPLLTPDLLICSVGTEIYQKTASGLEIDEEWNAELDQGWDRDKIVSTAASHFSDLQPQADSEQRPHKVSYHLHSDRVPKSEYVQQLRDKLAGEGLSVKVVHSGGSDVDVLPNCASKGLALQFLQRRWKAAGDLPTEGIQVNGDSGNDAELFEAPDVYGCVVSNAMAELTAWADAHPSERLFRATERCAAGIVETMRHFGKIPDDASLPPAARACQMLVKLYTFRMQWLNGAVTSEDALQKEIGSRLHDSFSMQAADGTSFDRANFLADAQADGGREREGAMLFWLDCVAVEADGAQQRVSFQLCKKRAGGEREPAAQYTAVLADASSAPEGLAIVSLTGSKLESA